LDKNIEYLKLKKGLKEKGGLAANPKMVEELVAIELKEEARRRINLGYFGIGELSGQIVSQFPASLTELYLFRTDVTDLPTSITRLTFLIRVSFTTLFNSCI